MRRAAKIGTVKLSPKRRREIASNAALSRWSKLSPEERSEGARARWSRIPPETRATQSYWAKLTPKQRSAEMKRRAKVRNQNRARKSKS
jgi:hypothetical protein